MSLPAALLQGCLIPPIPGFDCDIVPYPGPLLRVVLMVLAAFALCFALLNMDAVSRWVRGYWSPAQGPERGMFAVQPAQSSAATAPKVDPASVRLPGRGWFGQTLPGSDSPAVEITGWDGKSEGLSRITAHDPGFDQGAFLSAVQRVFFAALEAWTRVKPELSQGVMATVIWEQQKAQIDDYRRQGRRNVLDNLALINALIVGAQSDRNFDSLTVRMSARSADYDVDTATGGVMRGDRQISDWTEDWIFQRPSTAISAHGGGTISQPCPSCGAPVAVDITTVCPYCDAPVISGRFGWLLTRIERV